MAANTICDRCGAIAPAGTIFSAERIPFRGTRTYCPKCHVRFEERFLIGVYILIFGMAAVGGLCLLLNPLSKLGHVWVNLGLFQVLCVPSVVFHEFAHAIIGRLSGLNVLRVWIGRGRTFYRANLFGFDTEFKIIPFGGFTFLAHGPKTLLRIRYFLSILAGPAVNGIILAIAWKYTSFREIDLETSIQFAGIVCLTQALMLFDNLLPYRIKTALGTVSTDGLFLFQLLTSKSPNILLPRR